MDFDADRDHLTPADYLDPGPAGGGDVCLVDVCIYEHRLTDMDCLMATIGAFTGSIVGCFSCILLNPLGCVGCIVGLGGLYYLISEGCLSGSDCQFVTEEIPMGAFDDYDKSCLDYGPSNDNAIVVDSLDDLAEIVD